MVDFHYTTQGEDIILTLKTPITAIGTLHKMITVIYSLEWDILSGDIRTLVEDGREFSFDMLRIRKSSKKSKASASELALLMDTVFSPENDLQDIVKKIESKRPEPKSYFRSRSELIFEDDIAKNATVFYIETENARGLLYYLTKVLRDYRIDIRDATIETDPYTQIAKDTFYLRDSSGNLFGKLPLAEEVRQKILKPL